jgi:hypothetical protein
MQIEPNSFYKTCLLICLLLLIILLINVVAANAQNCEDRVELVSQPNIVARGGASFFSIEPEKIAELKAASLKPEENKCYLKITNNTAFDVNVFIDSVYVGFVLPGKQGYYKPAEDYKIVHCWSSAGDIRWVTNAGCSGCAKNLILLYKKQ